MRLVGVTCLSLLLGFLLPIWGEGRESGRYAAVDRHALSAPASAESGVPQLARYLSRGARTDEQKARAAFRWITANIDYDVPSYLSRKFPDQRAEAVLARRTAVCAGYAQLYHALAKQMGLEVAVVGGNCRVRPEGPPESHAWNSVKLNGKWHLLDSTWGAGSVDDKSRRFNRAFKEHYFLTPPEQLIFTHFPDATRWQLLGRPRTLAEFQAFPVVSSGYFQYAIRAQELHGYLSAKEGARLKFVVPQGVKMSGQLEHNGKTLPDNLVFAQTDGRHYYLDALFPRTGEYRLDVFATDRRGATQLDRCMQYRIKVTRASDQPAFPRLTATFLERKVFVERPLIGKLPAGKPVSFRVRVPGAREVHVISGDDWMPLKRQKGEVFTGEVRLRKGQATLNGQFSGEENHWRLLEYDVN